MLEKTPSTLAEWLGALPEDWTGIDEGPDTFSPFDVVGHLIQGELHDWMPRVRHILEERPEPFPPFERFAMRAASAGKSLQQLLEEFRSLRMENLRELAQLQLADEDLLRFGLHPELGPVTLGQLIATWVVHDLGHIAQIARVMAGRYGNEVGPWLAYLPVLSARSGHAD